MIRGERSPRVSQKCFTVALESIPAPHQAGDFGVFFQRQERDRAGDRRNSASRIWSKEACARPAKSCASQRDSLTPQGEEKWSENYTRNLKDVFAVRNRTCPNHRRTVERSADRRHGQSDNQGGDSSRSARRRKAERKMSRRMKLICRAAFFSIATQKKKRIKRAPLLNARCSWIPSSRSRGRGWPRRTSGIATMPPREARKASTHIWPPRARRWNERSPSNPTCRMRCSAGDDRNKFRL